ncbi:MAG: hypothetical protein IJ488_05905 [Clostridia bacterium]|nr:hypothetical protein [Clostridia bacterium]
MKKLLILLMALLTLLSLVACGGDEGDGGDGGHTHNFDKYLGQVSATCTTESYHRYVCSCGEENHITVAPAPGHDFNGSWTLEAAPTLTATGLLKTKCMRCQEEKEQVLPALNETDYQYTPASGVTCTTPTSQAIDRYKYTFNGREYDFTVQLEVPEHDYQPDPNEYYYIERCKSCGNAKEGTERLHEYVLDDYKAVCSVCEHESGREVFKVTATEGTTLVGTLSLGVGSERLYFDEPVTELFVFDNTYVIAKAPTGTYYDGVDMWYYTNDNGTGTYSDWSEEYDFQIWCDYSVHAKMDKKQARISVQWSYGLEDSEGNTVSPETTDGSYSYYDVNLGDTYTLVPGENTETTVFLGWERGVDDSAELFTNGEIVITEGTTDSVLDNNKFLVVTSSLTSLLPSSLYHDYILVSGYLYDPATLTVTKYDTPTRLPLNSAGNMDIQFVSYYTEENALYVKNVNEDGDVLARGLYYSDFGGNYYCLTDPQLDFRRINYTVSPENVLVDGVEYCEFKFSASGGRHTNLDLYWGKNAAWMYQGHNLASAQFYKAAGPEDYLDVSDISVHIIETNMRKLSTITVSLNSLPTEEELIAYYVAFMNEYMSYNGMNLYTGRPCTSIFKLSATGVNSHARSIYNGNSKLYMWLTNYYCCELNFSLDTSASALVITLEEVYKN